MESFQKERGAFPIPSSEHWRRSFTSLGLRVLVEWNEITFSVYPSWVFRRAKNERENSTRSGEQASRLGSGTKVTSIYSWMCLPSHLLQERQILKFRTSQIAGCNSILLTFCYLAGLSRIFAFLQTLSPLLEVSTWDREGHHFISQYEDCNVGREKQSPNLSLMTPCKSYWS